MARPSQDLDQALLASGLALYPSLGCKGLSMRRVAEHAGTRPAMLHYHFESKDAFLRAVLQGVYERLFERISTSRTEQGAALQRLRGALVVLTSFAREHRELLGRLLLDAATGETVVQEFLAANVPRHFSIVWELLQEAERDGSLRPMAPWQRLFFLMGSVGVPLLLAALLTQMTAIPKPLLDRLQRQVLGPKATEQRIDLALDALRVPDTAIHPKGHP